MYKAGDPVRVIHKTEFEYFNGGIVEIPAGVKVVVEEYDPNGAINAETQEPIAQVSFKYQGHEVKISADEVCRESS